MIPSLTGRYVWVSRPQRLIGPACANPAYAGRVMGCYLQRYGQGHHTLMAVSERVKENTLKSDIMSDHLRLITKAQHDRAAKSGKEPK